VSCVCRVSYVAVRRRSALHWAAHEGRKDCVEELLDKGADANMQGEYSVSPAHCAANAGQLDCLKMLLELGAQINICDDENQTPLHYVDTPPSSHSILLGLTSIVCRVCVVCRVALSRRPTGGS